MGDFNLHPHVREILDSLKEEPINTVEESKIFDLLVPIMDTLIPCEVWFAKAEGDITFTRVVLYPGTEHERLVDMDKLDGEWIDVYSCQPTPWTILLGPAIDLRINEQQKEK
jgi:hypothetical protein